MDFYFYFRFGLLGVCHLGKIHASKTARHSIRLQHGFCKPMCRARKLANSNGAWGTHPPELLPSYPDPLTAVYISAHVHDEPNHPDRSEHVLPKMLPVLLGRLNISKLLNKERFQTIQVVSAPCSDTHIYVLENMLEPLRAYNENFMCSKRY